MQAPSRARWRPSASAARRRTRRTTSRPLKGSITADGSSTVGPYTTAAAELFRKAGADGVKVTVGISGTGGGFQRFCKGEIDLSDASRPMKVSEAQRARTAASAPGAPSRSRTTRSLSSSTRRTLGRHVSRRRAEEDLGSGLEGEQLEGRSRGFSGRVAQAVRRRHRLGHVRLLHRGDQRQGQASRSDYQATEDDNVIVQGVSGERGGMGYFGYSYFEENKDKLKALQIRTRRPGSASRRRRRPQNGTYKPLARPLFIYAKGSSFKRKEVQAFLDYIFDNEARSRCAPISSRSRSAAQAGTDELHARGQGSEQELVSRSDVRLSTEGRPRGRPSSLRQSRLDDCYARRKRGTSPASQASSPR